jgi:hypothetical protein
MSNGCKTRGTPPVALYLPSSFTRIIECSTKRGRRRTESSCGTRRSKRFSDAQIGGESCGLGRNARVLVTKRPETKTTKTEWRGNSHSNRRFAFSFGKGPGNCLSEKIGLTAMANACTLILWSHLHSVNTRNRPIPGQFRKLRAEIRTLWRRAQSRANPSPPKTAKNTGKLERLCQTLVVMPRPTSF